MILHRPTLDKCKEIISDECNKAAEDVKVLGKSRGKEYRVYRGQHYKADDLYDIRKVQEQDLRAVLKRINEELMPDAQMSDYQQVVLEDSSALETFLQENHKDKWEASVGKMTPVGIALSILEELRTKKKKANG